MRDHSGMLYAPIGVLKPIADDVWIVDGPIIRFGAPWPKMPFSTRMTIVRLPGERLFIHSPIALTPGLAPQVAALGTPAWIVAPNRIHYWWVPDWHAAFPGAAVYLAPGVRERAGARIASDTLPLDRDCDYPWDDTLATLCIAGGYMTEAVFFHRPSATLILTDLIENFEPCRLGSVWMRWLTKAGGVQDPDGGMPRDMRLTFSRRKPHLRAAVAKMIAWNPQRIVIAHGRWYEREGARELRRAFRWLS